MSDLQLLNLSAEHANMILVDSAIDSEIAAERGTRTVSDPAELTSYGFAEYQCRSGILFPEWTVDGEQIGGSLRPDVPRLNSEEKALKYERPAGLTARLDVHPRVFKVLGDPSVPIAFTEGVKKADCLISHGIPAISLAGVWGWMNRNAWGQTALSSDFRSIVLRDRNVSLYFDNDLYTKPSVNQALAEFSEILRRKGARVRIATWRTGDHNEPKGIDDVYAAGRDHEIQFLDSLPALDVPDPKSGLLPVEPFPIEYLPERARRYAVEAADAHAIPVGMVAIPMLAAVGGLLGASVLIEEKTRTHHFPSVWPVVVAAPGVGKTAGQSSALFPIHELQNSAMKRHADAMEAYHRDTADWKREKSGVPPGEPKLEHLFTTDVTMEGLNPILQQEPGVVVALDEISSLTARFDQYRSNGKGSDRQSYLSIWSSAPLKIDRKNSSSVMVSRPVVSITGGCQPAVLNKVHDGQQDGFSDRMLFYWPDATPSPYSAKTISDEAEAGYLALFDDLYRIRISARDGALAVRMDEAATRQFRDWFNENRNLLASSPPEYQGMIAKLPQHVMRIALILHTMIHSRFPAESLVSDRTISGAIEMVECFASHARRVIAFLGRVGSDQQAPFAARVLRRLEDCGEWMTLTDIHRLFGNRTPSERLRSAIDELENGNRIERRRMSHGSRNVDQWRVLSESLLTDEVMNSDESKPETTANGRDLSTCEYPGCEHGKTRGSRFCYRHTVEAEKLGEVA